MNNVQAMSDHCLIWEPPSLSVSVTNFFQSFEHNNFRQEKYWTHEEAGFRLVVKQEAA